MRWPAPERALWSAQRQPEDESYGLAGLLDIDGAVRWVDRLDGANGVTEIGAYFLPWVRLDIFQADGLCLFCSIDGAGKDPLARSRDSNFAG